MNKTIEGNFNFNNSVKSLINDNLKTILPDWKVEYDSIWLKEDSRLIPEIKNIVYDLQQGTTIVFFKDGYKEIARTMEGDIFNKEYGVAMCITKKMYGSRAAWKKIVNSGVEKKVKVKKSNTVKQETNTYTLDGFLKGEFSINCETYEDNCTLLKTLHDRGTRWNTNRIVSTSETCWRRYREDTMYTIGHDSDGKLTFGHMINKGDRIVVPFKSVDLQGV